MKVTIELNLNEEEDRYDYDNIMQAQKLRLLFEEWTNTLRSKYKYSDNTATDWCDVREMWHQTVGESGVSLD